VLLLTEIVAKFQMAVCRKVIINISSGAGLKGRAAWSLYCAAKAGMENFIRSLTFGKQAQPQPFIPINIDPGVMDTQMQALIRSNSPADFPEVDRFIRRKDQGLLTPPNKFAAAILHILEQESLSFCGCCEKSKYTS
jgi:NAD(P)-dependent dehydrogenase (short-subunit alcohol dehydrogenase family)